MLTSNSDDDTHLRSRSGLNTTNRGAKLPLDVLLGYNSINYSLVNSTTILAPTCHKGNLLQTMSISSNDPHQLDISNKAINLKGKLYFLDQVEEILGPTLKSAVANASTLNVV